MSSFKVVEAFNGSAQAFGPAYPAVEIVVDPLLHSHGGGLVLKSAMATDQEIDTAIDDLIHQMEDLRRKSKSLLHAYRKKAAK